ncbi:hypothetical protein ABI59_08060 [Acidobacteria bacterium Mor1]|nr:hypothetical protein ABI59_08060 [Acidobacteria bacterium Mor1]
MSNVSDRGTLVLAALLLLSAGPAIAEEPLDPDDHQIKAEETSQQIAPGLPGMLSAEPTTKGLEYKRLTPIDDQEWLTTDPGYLWLLRQIDAGVADTRVMRQHHFLKQRLAPFDVPPPPGWRQQGLERLMQAPAPTTASTESAQIPADGRWLPIGPTNINGRVTSLARIPGIPEGILAGMADGGMWRTDDYGSSWDSLTDREATQATGAVAADLHEAGVYYWGTGEGNASGDSYSGIGILRSDDRGVSWGPNDDVSNSFRCLESDPANPGRVWACGDAGLYRSDDGGLSFSLVGGGLPNSFRGTELIFDPTDPQRMWVGLWGNGVWSSTDGGTSWTQVGGGLPADMGRNALAICESDPNVIAVASGLNAGDVWRSTDGGVSWNLTGSDPNHCGGQCWYDQVIGIAPDDCNTMYANGVFFNVTRNGGNSWSGTGSSIHVDHHAILTGPGGEVIVGNDGGIYRSTNYGGSFSRISVDLPSSQYYGACGNTTTAGWLAGGTQDRGTHRYRTSDGWRGILGADGGYCAADGDFVMGEFQNTNLRRSTNGGNSFSDANSGINPGDSRPWVGIIEQDPSDGQTLYVGTNRVYRSTDFHATPWQQILGSVFFNRTVSTLAVSPADRNVLWVGFNQGGVYRTDNALDPSPSFSDVRGSLPLRTVSRIEPHPTDPSAAWVVHAGFGYPKVSFTDNAGSSYTDVSGDFPDIPITDLLVDPGDTNVLIAGTDLGVYRSLDGGTTWQSFSEGLPTSVVAELFLHPNDGELIVATHGRSMFRYEQASTDPVAVPDGSAVAGAPMRLALTDGGDLRVRYDSESCTAHTYHLFWGLLADASSGSYQGSFCDIGRGGEVVLPLPGAAGDALFFLLSGASAAGVEGPHGYRSDGSVRPGQGVGQCGVASQLTTATCP